MTDAASGTDRRSGQQQIQQDPAAAFKSALRDAMSGERRFKQAAYALQEKICTVSVTGTGCDPQDTNGIFLHLTGDYVELLKQRHSLYRQRKNTIDNAYDRYRAARAQGTTRSGEWRDVTPLLQQRRELQHSIDLDFALLQLKPLNQAIEREMRETDITRSGLETTNAWLERTIESLKRVPKDEPLIPPIGGLSKAWHLLLVVLDMQAVRMERQCETYAATLSTRIDPAWPVFGPQRSANPDEQMNRVPATTPEAIRRRIGVIDRSIHYNEMYSDLVAEAGRNDEAAQSLSRHRAGARLHADCLLLRCQHNLIEAQMHYPAAIARQIDMPERLAEHLLSRVSNNLRMLNALFLEAQDAVASSRPDALLAEMRRRAGAEHSNDHKSWRPPETKAECEERYRLLRPLVAEFRTAADQLELLAISIERPGDASPAHSRACGDLTEMAGDLRNASDQIRTHMAELVLRGVNKTSVGDSAASAAAGERLKQISWIQATPRPTYETVRAGSEPVEETASPAETPVTAPASTTLRVTAAGKLVRPKAASEAEKLGTLAVQNMKWAKDCVDKLSHGNTDARYGFSHVRDLVQAAVHYRSEQLKSRGAEPQRASLERTAKNEERDGKKLIARAIALRPTQEGVDFAIANRMEVKVEQPYLLPITGDGDFVHEYLFSVAQQKFTLHAHYTRKDAGIDDEAAKVHYKRHDGAGGDQEGRYPAYYAEDRRARLAYRSEEAKRGIATAKNLLPPDKRSLAVLPGRPRR